MSLQDAAVCDGLTAIAKAVSDASGADRVYLFGSRAQGKGTEDSDYDLALLMPRGGNVWQAVRAAQRAVWPRRFALDMVPILREDWDGGGSLLAREVRKTGILLYSRHG